MQHLGIPAAAVCIGALACAPAWAQTVPTQPGADACAGVAGAMQSRWPDPSTRVERAGWVAAGTRLTLTNLPVSVTLPAHCEVIGALQERTGADDQKYAIKFHVRLPQQWNGRFFFQGGGGSNGELGDAVGVTTVGDPAAIEQGYAVVSQDSGHDNAVNSVPGRNGALAFGSDPQARSNYGGASLKLVADATKALIQVFYGTPQQRSYFYGCSKGGQEGMMFAQRYPDEFDGIVAAAPGFSLPRAALAEMWDVQTLGAVRGGQKGHAVALQQLRESFSDAQLKLARDAVLDACDADDGVRDGMTANFAACTNKRVMVSLNKKRCAAGAGTGAACLQPAQIAALEKVYAGPKDSHGKALYSDWPWDGGIGGRDWRIWKIGSEDGKVPSLNFVLGAQALAGVFTSPPTPVADNPAAIGTFVSGFDFDRDAAKLYAAPAPYRQSAWQDVGARSPDLGAFRRHGAKLIVPHGVSDPVFSVNDTLAWYREVNRLNGGKAGEFLRVFPLPGMAHCVGGPAVGQFNAFDALVAWVERDQAPDHLVAKGGPTSDWPERTRPVCAYPAYAKYKGSGSIEEAASFSCVTPPSH